MADPLSVTASVLAVATAAIVSIRSLCNTVKSFRGRSNILRRLQDKLQDLIAILEALAEVINADASVLALLEGPIGRCKDVCSDFERSMKKFHGKSKTGLLDWTKLEFMRGDINDFISSIEEYKSTITVGLGTINLRDSKVSLDVLEQYEELIKDTAYSLELRLQQIDEKLTRYHNQNTDAPDTIVDLQDEKAVTQQCLRVCRDASTYIGSLATRESAVLHNASRTNAEGGQEDFEAQVLLRQAFNTTQATFLKVLGRLGERLESVIMREGIEDEDDRLKLQQDLDISKQGLDLCNLASRISYQKIHRIGEAIAEEDSDQVVVTTLADLFDVRKATSRGRSAQLVATLTPDNFDRVVEKRYNSRFGAVPDRPADFQSSSNNVSPGDGNAQGGKKPDSSRPEKDTQPSKPEVKRDKPSSNEMRKRYGE